MSLNATAAPALPRKPPLNRYGVYLVAALLALFIMICLFPLRADADLGIYTEAAIKVLNGQVPYVDFYDINLLSAFYIHVPAVLVSRVFPINVLTAYNFQVFGLLVFACIAIVRILQRAVGNQGAFGVYIIPLILTLQSILFFTGTIYGEREHLTALILVVWFVLRWYRWQNGHVSPVWSFILGMLAAFVASIKPFFVPFFLAGDLYWLITKRDARRLLQPEVYGFLVFSALYFLYFFILNPRPFQVYLNDILPSVMSSYDSYGSVPVHLFILDSAVNLRLPFVVLPWLLRGSKSKLWSMARPLSLVFASALAAYVLQKKGLPYHRIPSETCLLIMVGLLLDYLLHRISNRRTARIVSKVTSVSLALMIVILVVSGVADMASNPEADGVPEVRAALEAYSAPGDAVLAVDTCCYSYPAIEQTGRVQASQFILAVPIPFAYYQRDLTDLYTPDHQVPALAQDYLDRLAAEIRAQQPVMILITEGQCWGCAAGFEMAPYLEARGIIPDVIEPEFERVEDAGTFRVYVRRG